ncbi:hypothetical protein BGX38DRAFT_1227572 [Terfezia claveryi]|nr:hypothetical protein BGX38DRAFT_1227572 [Terfezia claveryi]
MLPPKRDWPTLIVTYICAFLSLTFIAIRLICRRIRGERYWSFHDDMWMGISVFPLLLRLGLIHVVIVYGTNSLSMETLQALNEGEMEERILGSKVVLATRITYAAFLWCMKACILAFLSRLMSAEPKYARAIRVIGVGLVVTFVGVIPETFLECRPFKFYYRMPGPPCAEAFGQLITMGVLNIATDIVLIILPLPLIFKSRLPLLRKAQLSLLFMVSFAVIIVTVSRMPIILDSATMQNSRSLWASIEILVSCVVANAPILNNFYFEWKNKRRGGGAQIVDGCEDGDERGRGYPMKAKVASPHLKFSNCDAVGGRPAKGHVKGLSDESLTRMDAAVDGDNTIEATTSVTQNVTLASSEVMRTQQAGYYKGAFLGTQVWADQVFPGPKDPSQHINYGMDLSRQNRNNGAHAHHHTASYSSSRRPSHTITDIPSLGVLPSAPPRALLNAIANRKTVQARRGNADKFPVSAGIQRPYARQISVTAESEEELGGVAGALGASRASSISNSGVEKGPLTPGIEMDYHKHPILL